MDTDWPDAAAHGASWFTDAEEASERAGAAVRAGASVLFPGMACILTEGSVDISVSGVPGTQRPSVRTHRVARLERLSGCVTLTVSAAVFSPSSWELRAAASLDGGGEAGVVSSGCGLDVGGGDMVVTGGDDAGEETTSSEAAAASGAWSAADESG